MCSLTRSDQPRSFSVTKTHAEIDLKRYEQSTVSIAHFAKGALVLDDLYDRAFWRAVGQKPEGGWMLDEGNEDARKVYLCLLGKRDGSEFLTQDDLQQVNRDLAKRLAEASAH